MFIIYCKLYHCLYAELLFNFSSVKRISGAYQVLAFNGHEMYEKVNLKTNDSKSYCEFVLAFKTVTALNYEAYSFMHSCSLFHISGLYV